MESCNSCLFEMLFKKGISKFLKYSRKNIRKGKQYK